MKSADTQRQNSQRLLEAAPGGGSLWFFVSTLSLLDGMNSINGAAFTIRYFGRAVWPWEVAIILCLGRSAVRASGSLCAEAGTRAAAPFPTLTPLAASFLRCASDRFPLDEAEHFLHNRSASVATLRWCSGSSRIAVRLPSGISVRLRRNPQSSRNGVAGSLSAASSVAESDNT